MRARPSPMNIHQRWGDPYYPVPRPENQTLYGRYEALARATPDVWFVGRLATYRYYNMDQVVGQALATFRRIGGGLTEDRSGFWLKRRNPPSSRVAGALHIGLCQTPFRRVRGSCAERTMSARRTAARKRDISWRQSAPTRPFAGLARARIFRSGGLYADEGSTAIFNHDPYQKTHRNMVNSACFYIRSTRRTRGQSAPLWRNP